MKPALVTVFLCLSMTFAAQAWASTLPDACGNDKVKFKVTSQEDQSAPASPDAGKAQIIFLENENQLIGPFMHATVRFGVDGSWVGADYGNSYFAVAVEPGTHHLCANWQPSMQKKNVDLTSFTAEPGKVYYFEAHVTVESKYEIAFGLTQLNDDEGQYRLKASQLAASRPKK
jgi:hypothetical protein